MGEASHIESDLLGQVEEYMTHPDTAAVSENCLDALTKKLEKTPLITYNGWYREVMPSYCHTNLLLNIGVV
jgi:hypothetical protein